MIATLEKDIRSLKNAGCPVTAKIDGKPVAVMNGYFRSPDGSCYPYVMVENSGYVNTTDPTAIVFLDRDLRFHDLELRAAGVPLV